MQARQTLPRDRPSGHLRRPVPPAPTTRANGPVAASKTGIPNRPMWPSTPRSVHSAPQLQSAQHPQAASAQQEPFLKTCRWPTRYPQARDLGCSDPKLMKGRSTLPRNRMLQGRQGEWAIQRDRLGSRRVVVSVGPQTVAWALQPHLNSALLSSSSRLPQVSGTRRYRTLLLWLTLFP